MSRVRIKYMKKYSLFRLFCFVCSLFIATALPFLSIAGVGNTKHNLSASGPGTVKATSEEQVCIFCHTPHNAFPATPLWNHEITYVENYVNYWSPTLNPMLQKPTLPPSTGFRGSASAVMTGPSR